MTETGSVPPEQAKNPPARAYARAKFRLGLVAGGVDLALLVCLAFSGASVTLARWLAQRMGGNPSQGWLVLAYGSGLILGLKLVGLPFSVAEKRLERRHDLDRQSWAGWLRDEIKSLLLELGLGCGALELIYALLRGSPQHWWLWSWAAFTGFAVVMAQLAPVLLLPLFYKFRRLNGETPAEAELIARLTRLVQRAKTPIHGVFEWKLGEKSKKANAALTGWGATRRVIVSDTLLESSTPEEIEAVFAHELGHHAHHHIPKGMTLQTGLWLAGFWLSARVLQALAPRLHLQGIGDIAGLPILVLVAMLAGLIFLPLGNAFSRAMERQADDYAFATMGGVQALVTGLSKLAERNLAEVQPPRWKEVLFYSHPSIARRIERARAWEQAQRGTITT
jgi:STE24 endopeptidase